MKKTFVFLFLFLPLSIFCQDNIVSSNSGYANFQNEDYLFQVVLVNDLAETRETWNIPDVTPKISPTTTVEIPDSISLFVVYATDKDEIDLTYNLKIIKPGNIISDKSCSGLKIADTVITKRILYTASQLPTYILDETDEIGKYHFVVEVYDGLELLITFILEFNAVEQSMA